MKLVETMRPAFPQEYEQERMAILDKYAERDEKGNVVYDDEQKGLPKFSDMTAVKSEVQALSEKYKEVIEDFQKKTLELEKFMAEDVELALYKINMRNLPTEISQDIMNNLVKFDLIIED